MIYFNRTPVYQPLFNAGLRKPVAIDLKRVINHVFGQYLSKPYNRYFCQLFPKAAKLQKNNKTIYRPNHGLSHTLCSFKLAPLVAKYYEQYSNRPHFFKFNSEDIAKIQVALLFFVVGRENEMGFQNNPAIYSSFRKKSADAFKQYSTRHLMHLFKSHKEIDKYYNILLDYANPQNQSKEACVIRNAHCLDLIRCRNWDDYQISVLAELAKDLPSDKVEKLAEYTAHLNWATGTRISDGPYKRACHFNQFEKCSHRVDYCLEALDHVALPNQRLAKRFNG
jgi:hypothetical protein